MKDKNTEKYNAAHKHEICFGGTDDAGLGSAERGGNIIYTDIREENRQDAAVSPQTVTPVYIADGEGEKEILRCGRAGSRTARIAAASDPLSCSSVCVSHQYDSARRSNAAPRQGGGRRGTCARIAAPICAAVCALSLIHFSFSSGDIRPKAGLSSDYVPAAITFTPPEKLEPKGFWDYFSEAMAEFFGFYER